MEIKESRPSDLVEQRSCDSLHRSQFYITCKHLIFKGRISLGLSISVNFINEMSKLNN